MSTVEYYAGLSMGPPPCPSCADPLIVAAPFFDDSTGGSNACLQICRACRTLFDWRHEYTYLVNGASEDDTYVTRLDDAGARAALRQLFAQLRGRSRSNQNDPRAIRRPDAFDPAPVIPVDQPGGRQRRYPMMELLRGATLVRADCSGANLAGCDLRDADLRGTDFERADLTGADLRGARLDGASFLDARTVGVRS